MQRRAIGEVWKTKCYRQPKPPSRMLERRFTTAVPPPLPRRVGPSRVVSSSSLQDTSWPCFVRRKSTHSQADGIRKCSLHHPLFKAAEVREDFFWIEEKYFHSWNQANLFFVRGSDRDLLIDTGVGLFDLPAFLTSVNLRPPSALDKPLDVVLTHIHFDHSGGVHQFGPQVHRSPGGGHIMIHEAEAQHLTHPCWNAAWIMDSEVIPKPNREWQAKGYRVKPVQSTVKELQEGAMIDLGCKTFEVLHLPGHSPGSIALWERNRGILVTGDTLYQTEQELIDWYPGGSVTDLQRSVSRVADLIPSLDAIFPGHNDILEDRDAMLRVVDHHLSEECQKHRLIRKRMSKIRAYALLAGNAYIYPLPEELRSLLQR